MYLKNASRSCGSIGSVLLESERLSSRSFSLLSFLSLECLRVSCLCLATAMPTGILLPGKIQQWDELSVLHVLSLNQIEEKLLFNKRVNCFLASSHARQGKVLFTDRNCAAINE